MRRLIAYSAVALAVSAAPGHAQDAKLIELAKQGEFVNRNGIYPALPDADKIQAVEMDDFDQKGFAAKTQEYQKVFLQ